MKISCVMEDLVHLSTFKFFIWWWPVLFYFYNMITTYFESTLFIFFTW
jgi:hypothetical protein